MPTIVDVARHAGVSWNTVSRVINGDPSVRPETREVVLQAIRELDYVPNAAARSLKNSRTRTIGLIVSFLNDAVFHPIIAGIEAVVRDHGYSLLICDSNLDPRTEAMNLETLYQKHVEGLIFYPVGDRCPSLERFQRAKIPVLVMDWSEPTPGLPQLPLKHRAVIREAIEYLLGLGHQRIAFVGAISRFGRWRAEEFRQVWRELNLPPDPSLMARVIDQQ
jgi:LacI family transcriptional regulator